MTEEEYHAARYRILDDFYRDMCERLGLQEPVKRSLDLTKSRLGQLLSDDLTGDAQVFDGRAEK